MSPEAAGLDRRTTSPGPGDQPRHETGAAVPWNPASIGVAGPAARPARRGNSRHPHTGAGGAACAACSQPLSLPPSPVPGSGGDHGLARSGTARGGVPGAGGSGVEGLTRRLKVRALRSDPFSDSNGFLGALCGVRLHREPHERAGAASTLGAGKRGRAGGTHRRPHPGWRGPPPLRPADPGARPGPPPRGTGRDGVPEAAASPPCPVAAGARGRLRWPRLPVAHHCAGPSHAARLGTRRASGEDRACRELGEWSRGPLVPCYLPG